MSGLPIVAYVAALILSLVRRRWRKTGLFIAGAVLVAFLIAAITLLFDTLAKPLIEHYDWSGWHQAIYQGIYAVGALAASGVAGAGRAAICVAAGSPRPGDDFRPARTAAANVVRKHRAVALSSLAVRTAPRITQNRLC